MANFQFQPGRAIPAAALNEIATKAEGTQIVGDWSSNNGIHGVTFSQNFAAGPKKAQQHKFLDMELSWDGATSASDVTKAPMYWWCNVTDGQMLSATADFDWIDFKSKAIGLRNVSYNRIACKGMVAIDYPGENVNATKMSVYDLWQTQPKTEEAMALSSLSAVVTRPANGLGWWYTGIRQENQFSWPEAGERLLGNQGVDVVLTQWQRTDTDFVGNKKQCIAYVCVLVNHAKRTSTLRYVKDHKEDFQIIMPTDRGMKAYQYDAPLTTIEYIARNQRDVCAYKAADGTVLSVSIGGNVQQVKNEVNEVVDYQPWEYWFDRMTLSGDSPTIFRPIFTYDGKDYMVSGSTGLSLSGLSSYQWADHTQVEKVVSTDLDISNPGTLVYCAVPDDHPESAFVRLVQRRWDSEESLNDDLDEVLCCRFEIPGEQGENDISGEQQLVYYITQFGEMKFCDKPVFGGGGITPDSAFSALWQESIELKTHAVSVETSGETKVESKEVLQLWNFDELSSKVDLSELSGESAETSSYQNAELLIRRYWPGGDGDESDEIELEYLTLSSLVSELSGGEAGSELCVIGTDGSSGIATKSLTIAAGLSTNLSCHVADDGNGNLTATFDVFWR